MCWALGELMEKEQLEKAIKNLGVSRTINFNGNMIKLACLLRKEDRRPFQAEWWKGKQSYLIAVDDDGNFILSHSGGYIFRVKAKSSEEEILAKCEKDFLRMIEMDY